MDYQRKVARLEGEDRISALPDELIHHIMTFLDIDYAVQTSVYSKRWVNVWTTLTFVKFDLMHCNPYSDYYFHKQFLSNRDSESDTSTFIVNLSEANEYITYDIVDYATSHRVEHLELTNADIDWSFDFGDLKVLHLTDCKVPLMKWKLSYLETLCLNDVGFTGDARPVRFDRFKRLKKLTLEKCSHLYFDGKVFMISCPSLESLMISVEYYEDAPTRKFEIFAPKLSCLEFEAGYVPVLSVQDGFPSLETLKVDIHDYDNLEEKNQAAKKVISLLREFPSTKFLTLSFRTIKVLMRGPYFSEHQASKFGSLKSVTLASRRLIGQKPSQSKHQTNSINCLMNYFLKTSPSAKIFVE